MSFRSVFIALVIGFALVFAAFLVNVSDLTAKPATQRRFRSRIGQMRGMPLPAAVFDRARVRAEPLPRKE